MLLMKHIVSNSRVFNNHVYVVNLHYWFLEIIRKPTRTLLRACPGRNELLPLRGLLRFPNKLYECMVNSQKSGVGAFGLLAPRAR